jgi:hypothetical protein
MLIDLTEHLIKAGSLSGSWDTQQMLEIAEIIARSIADARINWDEGAGEAWCSILTTESVVAIINAQVPLMFLIGDSVQPSVLEHVLVGHNLIAIRSGSYDAEIFRMNTQVVCDVLGISDWPEEVSIDCFSVHDLWWATI